MEGEHWQLPTQEGVSIAFSLLLLFSLVWEEIRDPGCSPPECLFIFLFKKLREKGWTGEMQSSLLQRSLPNVGEDCAPESKPLHTRFPPTCPLPKALKAGQTGASKCLGWGERPLLSKAYPVHKARLAAGEVLSASAEVCCIIDATSLQSEAQERWPEYLLKGGGSSLPTPKEIQGQRSTVGLALETSQLMTA